MCQYQKNTKTFELIYFFMSNITAEKAKMVTNKHLTDISLQNNYLNLI